jgi:hypothetical protein
MNTFTPSVGESSASRPLFLFFGYGAEYSLHDLHEYMTAEGDQCVEIDMLTHPDTEGALKSLVQCGVVFITSAHLLYDLTNFFFYRTDRAVVSPLHVISTLEPTASVYYPHDLKDPIKPEEIPYLPLFDLLLSPTEALDRHKNLLHTETVGWIKRQPRRSAAEPESANPSRRVFFPGSYQYWLNRGISGFVEHYAPLFDAGVAIKLPRWHDNGVFEDALRSRGVRTYPSEANSIHVMEANDVVYTEALSSVGVEACGLGKRVCYIRNKELDYRDPIAEFAGVGRIRFVESPDEASRQALDSLPMNTAQLGYFDFHGARAAIHKLVPGGQRR